MKNKLIFCLFIALGLTSCKSTDFNDSINEGLSSFADMLPFKTQPSTLQIYPVFISDSPQTKIDIEDIIISEYREKLNLDPEKTKLYLDGALSQTVSLSDYKKLERSADCDFANKIYYTGSVLICRKEPKLALQEYKERANADEYIKQNKDETISVKWEEYSQYGANFEIISYKLKEYPNIVNRLKKDKKCKGNKSETAFICKHKAPDDLKSKHTGLLPSY